MNDELSTIFSPYMVITIIIPIFHWLSIVSTGPRMSLDHRRRIGLRIAGAAHSGAMILLHTLLGWCTADSGAMLPTLLKCKPATAYWDGAYSGAHFAAEESSG